MLRTVLLIILILFSGNVLADSPSWRLPVTGIYDGDTINSKINLKSPLDKVRIRIKGIDAPEIHGKCAQEIQHAIVARDTLKSLIGKTKTVTLTNYEWDNYGGRIAADVYVNGKNVAQELLKLNVVRPFTDSRQPWCV